MGRTNRLELISRSLIDAIGDNKNTILGEIMLGVNFFNKEKGSTPNKRVKQKNSTDKYVRYCPECNLAWEYTRVIGTRRNRKTIYYNDFPKYGKSIEVCNKCEPQEEE